MIAVEIIPVGDLTADGRNPNRMADAKYRALRKSILDHGFIVPVVTNAGLLIADGEHRWRAARELGLATVPVVRLPVADVDRRMLRQVLNRVRGEHEPILDAIELKGLLDEVGADELCLALGESAESMDALLGFEPSAGLGGGTVSIELTVRCADQTQAEDLRTALALDGDVIDGGDLLERLRPHLT